MFKNDYERLLYYYTKGWASESQIRLYVKYGVITPAEYTLITGKPYVQS